MSIFVLFFWCLKSPDQTLRRIIRQSMYLNYIKVGGFQSFIIVKCSVKLDKIGAKNPDTAIKNLSQVAEERKWVVGKVH